jgi:hypothetical protein
VSIVPLERKFLGLLNGNKFQNVKILVLIFLDENPGQKCDFLEMAKSEGGRVLHIPDICVQIESDVSAHLCRARSILRILHMSGALVRTLDQPEAGSQSVSELPQFPRVETPTVLLLYTYACTGTTYHPYYTTPHIAFEYQTQTQC